ncbi:MAG TPA: alpha/beta fold hydrolase [Stellaceae bacterium]|nr:alpha/beta fold hydrolase [Stellaceae bacterium]
MPAALTEIRVRDVAIKLHRAGRGPRVLFLHGAGGVPQWLPFFDALAERCELFVPEHPGFGGSDDPPWIASMPDLAMFYLDFLVLRLTFEMLMPPGYTSMNSMKNFVANRRALGNTGGRMTAEMLIESGTALIGSPKTVLAGIEKMRERTGFGILVCLLQFGVLSDELTRRNMDMFAAEVMPHLRS